MEMVCQYKRLHSQPAVSFILSYQSKTSDAQITVQEVGVHKMPCLVALAVLLLAFSRSQKKCIISSCQPHSKQHHSWLCRLNVLRYFLDPFILVPSINTNLEAQAKGHWCWWWCWTPYKEKDIDSTQWCAFTEGVHLFKCISLVTSE